MTFVIRAFRWTCFLLLALVTLALVIVWCRSHVAYDKFIWHSRTGTWPDGRTLPVEPDDKPRTKDEIELRNEWIRQGKFPVMHVHGGNVRVVAGTVRVTQIANDYDLSSKSAGQWYGDTSYWMKGRPPFEHQSSRPHAVDPATFAAPIKHIDPLVADVRFAGLSYQHSHSLPSSRTRDVRELAVPLWMPTLLLALLTVAFAPFRLLCRLRRRRRGLCPTCNYDLRAHAPGDRCPECGSPTPPPPTNPTPPADRPRIDPR